MRAFGRAFFVLGDSAGVVSVVFAACRTVSTLSSTPKTVSLSSRLPTRCNQQCLPRSKAVVRPSFRHAILHSRHTGLHRLHEVHSLTHQSLHATARARRERQANQHPRHSQQRRHETQVVDARRVQNPSQLARQRPQEETRAQTALRRSKSLYCNSGWEGRTADTTACAHQLQLNAPS